MKHPARIIGRRRLLGMTTAAATLTLAPGWACARDWSVAPRALALSHLHTGEKLKTTYWANGDYVPGAVAEINRVLRDHVSGAVAEMDLRLLDLLTALRRTMDSNAPFEIISGYRSPATNAALRSRSHGVAKNSLHMRAMAIDIRLPGRDLSLVREAAMALKRGGVGYYPKSKFIHVDTGAVRFW